MEINTKEYKKIKCCDFENYNNHYILFNNNDNTINQTKYEK